jgi:hypothetical protein
MVTHKIVNGNYKIVNGNYRIVNGKIVNGTARPPVESLICKIVIFTKPNFWSSLKKLGSKRNYPKINLWNIS